MKLQFEPNLDFQTEATAAVVDLFRGQETCQSNFTVAPLKESQQIALFGADAGFGVGNRLILLDDDLFANLKKIQLRHGLAPAESLASLDFTVEMETGTGKTYVYLRTIFELHRAYGFTKFIIVVPSIAIKEGTHKSLQITREHFKGLYDNVPFDYFVYDSDKLGQVRTFATSENIQVMVINIDAFRKSFADPEQESKANIIHRPHDRMNGEKPIDFIRQTNPIVIIDEPQSVDTTDKSKEAIASLNPLCTLRYSATHREKHHQVYRLDAVDAYERKLVKQIEVASIGLENSHNQAYVRLVKADNKRGPITCDIELDVLGPKGRIDRVTKKKVRAGADLLELSNGRDVYQGFIIDDIHCAEGQEQISFTGRPEVVRLGECIGALDDNQLKRLQIRKTIEEHLDKELRLRSRGIKVLSLFFIDKVANYRSYDEEGTAQKGKYAEWFEAEYTQAIRKPKYADLFQEVDRATAADGVHDGYFAIDKVKGKERFKDSRGEGTTAADEGAYQLIMRDKEKLLSFSSKLKFIFSHSALKEGWDNPNVFQICTLNETSSVMRKRQQIGRGLRICVDQSGQRVHEAGVNTLTVFANESFDDFARGLQREIEEDTGIRFGFVEKHMFANITVATEDGKPEYLGVDASQAVWQHLKDAGYIDTKGRVTDKLKADLKAGNVSLPEDHKAHALAIQAALRKVAGDLNIKNKDKRERIQLNKAIALGENFQALWDRIKHKTTFRVSFDSKALIARCAEQIEKTLVVPQAHFSYNKDQADITRGGVIKTGVGVAAPRTHYQAMEIVLPDIVSYLQNETQLTRKSIVAILTTCGKLDQFKRNPQKFIEGVLTIIQHQMRLFIVNGIKYERIGDADFYAQELFETQELMGYLEQNMIESKKSPYTHIVYESEVEAEFARSFELSEEVKVYAKLPSWFTIPTPLGTYNPDWAVLVERDDAQRLYFVVESKGSILEDALRPREKAKIDCGKAHFAALGQDVTFTEAESFDTFMDQVAQ